MDGEAPKGVPWTAESIAVTATPLLFILSQNKIFSHMHATLLAIGLCRNY